MKFLIAFALFALVAAKPSLRGEQAEIDEIVAAINSPSTDPATASALQQLLEHILGIFKPEPIAVGPAIVDSYEPIAVGPAIVDSYEPISVGPAIVDSFEPISVGPAIVDSFEPISVGPAIIDFPVPESALAPTPVASPPLVQIIVNVQQPAGSAVVGSPVVVEGIDAPHTPVTGVEGAIIPSPSPTPVNVIEEAYVPESVNVVDSLPIIPEPVIVVEQTPVAPEPVIVAPVIVAPAVIAPEILN